MIDCSRIMGQHELSDDALPKNGEEIWHQIFENTENIEEKKPIGHCYHRSLALVHALHELDTDALTMLVFATAKYLSMGKAPEEVAGKYANHFITRVKDRDGSIIWADCGRPLEYVEEALKTGGLEFPEDSMKKVEADPARATRYIWRNPLNGKTIYCGERAIEFAVKQRQPFSQLD
jgi:hypothetical protein